MLLKTESSRSRKNVKFTLLLTLIALFIFSAEIPIEASADRGQTICLNMIVKDETRVIKRCLESVKPFIDYWVIVDTGSTDGTQTMIKEFMIDIPGELHERPWINFEHNRNEALLLAEGKGDYLLVIDADEELSAEALFSMPLLNRDFYFIQSEYGGTSYSRVQLINSHLDWKWTGVLHEAIECKEARTFGHLSGLTNVVHTDGFRSSDPKKYQKDVSILETALKNDPENPRYVFYLAQSYRDAGDLRSALKNYHRRTAMHGWDQEIFWSMYQVAKSQEALEMKPEIFVKSYYDAYHYRPSRAEPLYHLTRHYRFAGNHAAGYAVASTGMTLPLSKDFLFVEKWIYDYGLPLEFSVCAYWIGKYEECQQISLRLLAQSDLPSDIRELVQKNLAFANSKIIEKMDLQKLNH